MDADIKYVESLMAKVAEDFANHVIQETLGRCSILCLIGLANVIKGIENPKMLGLFDAEITKILFQSVSIKKKT